MNKTIVEGTLFVKLQAVFFSLVSDCQGFENLCGFWVGYAGVGVRVSFFNPWQTHTPGRGLRVYPSTISHGFFLPVRAWT